MESISPIVIAAAKVIEKSVPGVKVVMLGPPMKRSEPSAERPFWRLGADVEISWEIGGERVEKVKTFLSCQLCEDMLTPLGHLVAEEIIFMLYRPIFERMKDELDL